MTEIKYIFPKQLQSVAALAFIAVLIILQHVVQVPLAVISEWSCFIVHKMKSTLWKILLFLQYCVEKKKRKTQEERICV